MVSLHLLDGVLHGDGQGQERVEHVQYDARRWWPDRSFCSPVWILKTTQSAGKAIEQAEGITKEKNALGWQGVDHTAAAATRRRAVPKHFQSWLHVHAAQRAARRWQRALAVHPRVELDGKLNAVLEPVSVGNGLFVKLN